MLSDLAEVGQDRKPATSNNNLMCEHAISGHANLLCIDSILTDVAKTTQATAATSVTIQGLQLHHH